MTIHRKPAGLTGHAGLTGKPVGAHLQVDEALTLAVLVHRFAHCPNKFNSQVRTVRNGWSNRQ